MARRAGSFAADAAAAAAYGIGRKPEINDVKYIEKFGAKFEDAKFTTATVAERRVLNQGGIELMKPGAAKGVAPYCAKATGVGASPARDVDRNIEKRTIVGTTSKLVFTNGTFGRKIRHGNRG